MSNVKLIPTALCAAAVALASTAAEAKVYAFAALTNNFSSGTTTPVFVPLMSSLATALTFNTGFANNKKVIISFSAECAASGTGGWVNIDILVDGVAVAPTDQTSDAFCSADTTPGFDHWSVVNYTVGYTVPTGGAHTLQIRATATGGATGVWLGDSATVIQD